MKTYLRITLLFLVVAVVMVIVYTTKQVSAPESALIAAERNRIYAERDQARMAKDPSYAQELKDKLQVLDYRLAVSYNAENNPDAAIVVLRKMIVDEQGKNNGPRRSRSYLNEVRLNAVLKDSYDLKKDENSVKKTAAIQDELNAKAASAKKREMVEEGKHVGSASE